MTSDQAVNQDVEPQEPTNPEPQEPQSPAPPPQEPAAQEPPSAEPPQEPEKAEPNWRERIANGDEDIMKIVSRYNSEHEFAKAHQELRQKLSSGEYKKEIPFPEDGTEEQIAEWRKENGIPETPEDYELDLGDGLVIGDDDKPIVDEYLKKIHDKNLPPDVANKAIASYFELQQEMQAKQVEEDRAFQQQTEEALREDWGSEYIANKNLAKDFAVTRFGEDVGQAIMEAGPDAVKAMAAIARDINPAMTVVPNSSDPNSAIASELESLKGIIGTDEWYASPEKQARYKQLINAQSSMKDR